MNAAPVRYVTTSDGYDIAYRVTGNGMPLVFVPPLFSDIQVVWQFYPQWLEGLAQRFQLIQYDSRGEGLSSRNLPDDLTLADFSRDLETVVERLGLKRFLVWGWTNRSHHAVRYAHAHPEHVAGLILNTCAVSNTVYRSVMFNALPLDDWDVFLRTIAPRDLSPEESKHRIESIRAAITPEDFDAQLRVNQPSNVERELRGIRVPTLVLHPRDWRSLPVSESIKVAALIPDARFVLIDGASVYGDPDQGLAAVDAFVANLLPPDERGAASTASDALPDGLSQRELEVLRLLTQGKSNPEIAKELFITRNTVQNHVSSILIKTNLNNRAQAAVYAQQHGIV
jgi:DNA-binding CsgD family transcriptional regulator/pimeloyl-ACP methyl ester carboxylesterase